MIDHADQSPDGSPDGGRHRSKGTATGKPRARRTLILIVPVLVVATLLGLFLGQQAGTSSPAAASGTSAGRETSPPGNTADVPSARPTNLTAPAGTSTTTALSPRISANPAVSAAPGTAGGCPLPGGTLTVAAAPEIADIVRLIGAAVTSGDGNNLCTITVRAQDPADFLASWQTQPQQRPAVWIPDSSIWVERATQAGITLPVRSPSVATSPVVLALSAAAAHGLSPAADGPISLQRILATRLTKTPIRFGVPDPVRSAASVIALTTMRAATTGETTGRAALTWAMRSGPAGLPTTGDQLLAQLAGAPGTAVPVSEQAVWADITAGGPVAVTSYLPAAASSLDYPFVVTQPDAGPVAASLLGRLQSSTGVGDLLDRGFRDADGRAGASLTKALGFDPAPRPVAAVPTSTDIASTIRDLAISNEPSRLLAVLDVSGSMASVVPGTAGATRLDLARAAAIRGLSLYPANSQIGLWVFSRDLTPTTDYRELVPVGTAADQAAGHPEIGRALETVQVNPDGGTGLYDTTLAAVRQLQAHWDPTRVNTVLILSDGQNDDQGSISLADLLSTLHHEADPARPVPVVAIAFGPDSDVQAMTQISKATGGSTYVATDPREIGEIFLDSVGQRLCRPNC